MEPSNSNRLEIARQIVEIVPTVMQIVAAELRRGDYPMVPTQLGVLTMLAHHPCNLSELARYHLVSLPTMSGAISKMVQQGWVMRRRSEQDRRLLELEITDAGLAVWERIGSQVIANITALLSPVSSEDREALFAGLAVLRDAFAVVPQPFPLSAHEL